MAKVKITGHASGTGILTVTAPNTSTDRTITLPDATGTLLNSDGDGSSLTGISSVGGSSGVDFNDNVKARFGTGNDLEIYHDASHSRIKDTGTGNLYISGSAQVNIQDAAGEPMISCVADGTVQLSHHGDTKLATSATGVTVTGVVTATTFTGAATDSTKLPLAGGTLTGNITLGSSSYFIAGNSTNAYVFNSVGDAANLFIVKNDGRSLSEFTARAWAHFNGTGTPALNESHNVSSLTDVSTGNWNVVFETAMATTTYACVANCEPDSYDDENCCANPHATTNVRVNNRRTGSGTGVDNGSISVIVFKE